MSTAIRFQEVSKRFTLHHQRPRSFQELVIQLLKRNGGSRGQQGDGLGVQMTRGDEEFWALQDVSFQVQHGETVGIIGPNGAGKSTVLKLISRIIEPTSGDIEVNGRIGALLELGAGFHPDLSGRENIYLNGSILGLGRSEIGQKVEEIIGFAELERFIDMPIRHYSSGMRMRLGFSIAAHSDPEILLVDEVLAVGDESFQHKCLDRIMEMRQQGITICFVSHGLGSVRRLCSRAIWLSNGAVEAKGTVDDVISAYLRYAANEEESRLRAASHPVDNLAKAQVQTGSPAKRGDSDGLEIADVSFLDAAGNRKHVFRVGEPWAVRVDYRAGRRMEDVCLELTIQRNDGLCVWESAVRSTDQGLSSVGGEGVVVCYVDGLPLMEGTYSLSVSVRDGLDEPACDAHRLLHTFRVRQVGTGERYGLASLQGAWDWREEKGQSSAEAGMPGRSDRDGSSIFESERRWGTGDIQVVDVSFVDAHGVERRVFEAGEPWSVRLRYRARRRVENPVFGLAVHRDDGVHVCGPNTQFDGLNIPYVEGEGELLYNVDRLPLVEGTYSLSVSAHNRMDTIMFDYQDRIHPFKVFQFGTSGREGVIVLAGEWRWKDRGKE